MALLASAAASSPARFWTSSSPSWNGDSEAMIFLLSEQRGVDILRASAAGLRRPALQMRVWLGYVFCEEVANVLRDERAVFLEGEMAGVEKVEFGARIVLGEGFGTRGQKDGVVLAPD